MTNLEAMIYGHGWQGGTIHQFDEMYKNNLRVAGVSSIMELQIDTWIDFLGTFHLYMPDYHKCKKAYLHKFGGKS